MRGRVRAQPLLQVSQGARSDKVELKRAEAQAQDMAMSIDEAGQHRSPFTVDHMIEPAEAWVGIGNRLLHPAIVADQKASEMLDLSVRARLDSIDVADERVGPGRGAEERCAER
jgi:hypothetical protein